MISPDVPRRLRAQILEMACRAGGGHIGGSFSIIDVLAELYLGGHLRPQDKVIYSKGHACLALYAVLHERGLLSPEDIAGYNKNGALLGGHPKSNAPGVLLSTGALGHGLPVAVGLAYASDANVVCVVGDGEMNEGSCWEAVMFAAQKRLKNLLLIVDNNGMESLDRTDKIMSIEPVWDRLDAFGWSAETIDGHNPRAVCDAIDFGLFKPHAIIADTVKGKGVSFMENEAKWHYRCPSSEERELALKELLETSS